MLPNVRGCPHKICSRKVGVARVSLLPFFAPKLIYRFSALAALLWCLLDRFSQFLEENLIKALLLEPDPLIWTFSYFSGKLPISIRWLGVAVPEAEAITKCPSSYQRQLHPLKFGSCHRVQPAGHSGDPQKAAGVAALVGGFCLARHLTNHLYQKHSWY